MSLNNIYFDNAASTAISPTVADELHKFTKNHVGNASSIHRMGLNASMVIERARDTIAKKINARAEEIIFTSGGTESNNLALIGTALANRIKGNHIIISAIEHSSILETAKWLAQNGFRISYLPVSTLGLVDLEKLKELISTDTILVSIQHANNEVGVVQDILAIGKICRDKSTLFHTDCTQSFGKLNIDISTMNIDLLTLSSHKIHGPMGVGALYVRTGTKIEPVTFGGRHEGGLRSGTQNVTGIYGFSLAAQELDSESSVTMAELKNRLLNGLKTIGCIVINSASAPELPNIINISLKSHKAREVLNRLSREGIFVSTSSACSSGKNQPSHVLTAMGQGQDLATNSLRISLSKYNTAFEVDFFLTKLKEILNEY